MGVHGLWKLIESAGKPVPVETLDNKILAVDVSIWLHQLMKGYQTPSGANLSNAYLMGLFTRVCKLLFTNVKPVFVFDGGVPQLKRKTIAARQQQRNKAEQISEKLREQLLKNLLKQKAVSQVLEEIRGQTSPKKKAPDMYELPPLPEAEDSPSDVEEMSNSSSEEDVKPFKMKYKDLHSVDVNSADFKALPADMRHDILSELKETRKQSSWGRIHEMPEESGDFSKYQMSRLLKRRSVQVSLEEAEKEMGGRTLSLGDVESILAEGGVEINPQLTKRIASDEVTRYIYVRETGEKQDTENKLANPSTSGGSKHTTLTTDVLDPNITIKEEIIDSDEMSDSELIKEVEAIERMYKVNEKQDSNVKDKFETEIKIKEENVEFGTEDMFEHESSSEGIIIDEMDLVEDNSGLSQNQILTIIKQQNCVGEPSTKKHLHVSVPSTNKEYLDALIENTSSDLCSVDSKVSSKHNKSAKQPLQSPESSDSKRLDSLCSELSKNLQSILAKKNKASDQNKITDVIKSLTVNLPALDSSSIESGNRTGDDLPCTVSEIVSSNLILDTSCSKNIQDESVPSNFILNTSCSKNIQDESVPSNFILDTSCSKNKKYETVVHCATTKQSPSPILSSSESDDEFLVVPISEDVTKDTTESNITGSNKTGLQIEIQPVKNKIEDDIFADIFLNEDKTVSDEILNDVSKTKGLQRDGENKITLEGIKSSGQPTTRKLHSITQKQRSPIKFGHSEEKSNVPVSIDKDELDRPSFILNKDEKTSLSNLDQSERSRLPTNEEKEENHSSFNNPEDSDDSMTVDDPPTNPEGELRHVTSGENNSPSNNANHQDPEDSIIVDKQTPNSEDKTYSTVTTENPKRILNTKQLEKLQDILESKERDLVINQNREDRMATSLTDQMYQEAQELLRLFGLPYIVAPMEAEAQCAFLDSAGLTQGTITDDSDIWLFGGNKVYKNFFDQKKFVLEFKANDIQQYFRLSRSHLVLLALLVGSDYTVGLQGVGAVTALEILATFPPSRTDSRDPGELLTCLDKFKRWWQSHKDTHTHDKLASKLKNIDLSLGFPSTAVVTAYLQPLVDDSREPFSWGSPDLPGLRDYTERKFGWSRSRTDQILQPVINRLSQTTSQLTLHTFFGAVPNITAHREQMSRRVQTAVNRLAGGSEDFTAVQPRPRQPRGRGRGRGSSEGRGGARGRASGTCLLDNHESCVGSGCNAATELIPQRERDKLEALKRKQEAIEVLKNKKRKGTKKRKNIRQVKAEADLSESSDDN